MRYGSCMRESGIHLILLFGELRVFRSLLREEKACDSTGTKLILMGSTAQR